MIHNAQIFPVVATVSVRHDTDMLVSVRGADLSARCYAPLVYCQILQ